MANSRETAGTRGPGAIVFATAAASLVAILAVSFPGSPLYGLLDAADYLLLHNLIEIFGIVVSFSIFGLGWFAFSPSLNRSVFMLSTAFALVGAFDLFHALSFPGMPELISPSSTNKGILFWEAARLSSAFGLLAGAFARRTPTVERTRKAGIAALGVAVAAATIGSILLFERYIPPMFVEGVGLTGLKIAIEYLVILLFGVSFARLLKRPLGDMDASHTLVLCAIVLGIASEFAFTLYKSAYDSFNLLGHLFKLLAYLLLYRGIFVMSVSKPFDFLRRSEEELRLENEKRTRSESALEESNRELAVVYECNQAIVRAENEQGLLDTICAILCRSGGYRMAWVGYAIADEDRNVRPISREGDGRDYLSSVRITWGDGPLGSGPTGSCIREGRSYCVQEYAADPSVAPWREKALAHGFRSSIGLPLKEEDGRTFGALSVYSAAPESFKEAEIRLLEALAEDLSYAIRSLRARAKNREDESKILAALHEKEILLRELHHRTRNNMQVISSLLYLERERIGNEADRRIIDSVGMRIQAMSLVHQKLFQSGDLSRIELRDYIVSLCGLVRQSDAVAEERITFDFSEMEEVEVLIDTAVPLGIVLHELLANSFCHAFPGDSSGTIRVSLHRDEEGLVSLGFADDGVGFDAGEDPRACGHMGFMLVFDLVTLQLGGQIDCTTRKGTAWSIRFRENRYQARI